jgi:probable rRNA maturation factor
MNKRWRKLDRATDVLAFAQREGEFAEPGDPVLGDIVISVERAAAQARERGHTLEREMDVLLVHGLLHLLGHEHTRGGKEAQKMRAMEKELLAGLNK